jgi:hypothetical protein
VAINNHLVVVSIPVMVAILLDDDRVPIPMFVTITYDRAIAISVSVSIMSRTDGHASRPDTNSNVFRVRRRCGTKACNGGDNQSVFHQVSPNVVKLGGLRSRSAIGSD